jgi:hypothetical protein
MSVFLLFVGVFLIFAGTGSLGIFISRKSELIKKNTSKSNAIIFAIILSLLAFFGAITEGYSLAGAIGFTVGYVFLFTLPSAYLGVLFINKFKFNKKEIWTSTCFVFLWVLIIYIRQYVLKL